MVKLDLPSGRYNEWGERKGLPIVSQKELIAVNEEIDSLSFSSRAKDFFLGARYTESLGLEFVFASDAQFPCPIIINEIHLVPCFKPLVFPFPPGVSSMPSDDRQSAMMKKAWFIYDGWVPSDLSQDSIEQVVCDIDDVTNLFSVVGRYHAVWQPKYQFDKPAAQPYLINIDDFESLAKAIGLLNRVSPHDKKAISRSAAWITHALKDSSHVQRFLLLCISIETLATFIEGNSSGDSSLRIFAEPKEAKTKKKLVRDDCINELLSSDLSLSESIKRAYHECVEWSNKKMLERHLMRVFNSGTEYNILFREKVSGKTLWQIRNDIAHGNLDLLSDEEKRFLSSRLFEIETIARNYIRRIMVGLGRAEGVMTEREAGFFKEPGRPGFVISEPSYVPGFTSGKYMGPTDMAEYYMHVETLSSSFYRY